MPSAPAMRGVKKGLASASKVHFGATKEGSKQRKKLASFDPSTLFVENSSLSKPQTPGKSLLGTTKTPKSGKTRRALGDISNRKVGESENKNGKPTSASQSFTVVAKPLFKSQPEYEYPDIELPAGNISDVEDALVEKLDLSILPDDFPFPDDGSTSPKRDPNREKSQDELLIGSTSLLDGGELDQMLESGLGSDFVPPSTELDDGPVCDDSLGF